MSDMILAMLLMSFRRFSIEIRLLSSQHTLVIAKEN